MLLNLETNNTFISRNVVFFEDVFPMVKTGSKICSDFFDSLESLPSVISPLPPITAPPSPTSTIPLVIHDFTSMLPLPKHRPKKLPAHLQDYHCYLNNDISHPVSAFLSYSNLIPSIFLLSIVSPKSLFHIPMLKLRIPKNGVVLLIMKLVLWKSLKFGISLHYLIVRNLLVVVGYLL